MTHRARVESETAKRAYGMTFTDRAFAIFLPVVFALYWLARFKTAQNLVLLGHSLLCAVVDADEFTAFSGRSTVIASSNGSSSLWWYLYVKNVASQISHRPSYVGILFRDAFLTEPGHCVTGEYRKPIRQLITAGEELVDTLSFGGRGATDVYSILRSHPTWRRPA